MEILSVRQEAHGIIAIGQVATGLIAIGQMATGLIAIGQIARGVFAIGQVAVGGSYSLGMVAVAPGYSVGLLAMGSRAAALLPVNLLPRRKKAEEPSASRATFVDFANGSVQSGVIEVRLAVDPRGDIAAFEGDVRVPIDFGPVRSEAREIANSRYPMAWVSLRAESEPTGSPFGYREATASEAVYRAFEIRAVPRPPATGGASIALWILRIVGLLAVTALFAAFVGMPILDLVREQ